MDVLSWLILIGGIASTLSVLISMHLIIKHLTHYTNREFQRLTVRILLMVPIYAVDSWLSLRFHEYSLYLDLFRDCYEAYVLYIFFRLLVAYCGGEHRLAVILTSEPPLAHPFPMCCLPKINLGWGFLRTAKISILQFVLIKPLCALVAVSLNPFGYFGDGEWRLDRAYVYLTFIENFSVTLSMYFLVLFYQATHSELEPYKPLGKFLCIKAVLFLSFWQSVTLSGLEFFELIPPISGVTELDQEYVLEDFLICCEMFLISIAHVFAFGYADYVVKDDPDQLVGEDGTIEEGPDADKASRKKLCANFVDVVVQGDVLDDTKQTLALRPKLVRRFTSFFDQPSPIQFLVTGCYLDCRSNYHASLKEFDIKFAAVLSHPPGLIICKANPFKLAADQKLHFGRPLSSTTLSSHSPSSSSSSSSSQPSSSSSSSSQPSSSSSQPSSQLTTIQSSSTPSSGKRIPSIIADEMGPKTIEIGEASRSLMVQGSHLLDEEHIDDPDWVFPSDAEAAQLPPPRTVEPSPFDITDITSVLPCDLIDCWISAKKLPMISYRPSKSSRNSKLAIDVLTIHLQKNFHILPYIFQLRGTGEELLYLAESINAIRSLVMREMNLLGEHE